MFVASSPRGRAAVTATTKSEDSRSHHLELAYFRALAFLRWTFGLCISGRHFHGDRSARVMCCNGWRRSWSWISINGELRRIASWRPIGARDPRFPWEDLPAGKDKTARFPADDWTVPTPVNSYPERDWSMESRLERLALACGLSEQFFYDGMPPLQSPAFTLLDAHLAGGKLS